MQLSGGEQGCPENNIFVCMRYAAFMYFFLLLFCCGRTVSANTAAMCRQNMEEQVHTTPDVHFPVHLASQVKESAGQLLQVQSRVPQLWDHWHNCPQDEMVSGMAGNRVIILLNTGSRDGADTYRAHFLSGIDTTGTTKMAARLLQDLHAIVRSLIFPQHYFW